MSAFYLTLQRSLAEIPGSINIRGLQKIKKGPSFFTFTSFSYSQSPHWFSHLCVPAQPEDSLPRLLAPVAFSTLPGSSFHNIMITVWEKCLLGIGKQSCGWKMFPHNYAVWQCRMPLILHYVSFGQLKTGRKKCSLLPAASELWLESARCGEYHSCILQSMTWLPQS